MRKTGLPKRAIGCLLLTASLTACGCVERRFVVESNQPGARVFVNNEPVGFAPVDVPFTYYGTYNIKLEKDGYQTETFQERIAPPWYAYPPFDFIVENLYPGQVRDTRVIGLEMKPVPPSNPDAVRDEAEELRSRGQALPEPKTPATPRR